MGANNSKARIDQVAVNKTVMSTIVKNQNEQSVNANVSQKMNIEGVEFKNCTLEIEQTADVSVESVMQFSQSMTSELLSKLKQEVDNQLTNKMKPETELLAPPQVTNTKSDIRSRVYNILENTINVENINKNIIAVNGLQEEFISKLKVDKCPGYQDTLAVLALNPNLKPSVISEFVKSCDKTQVCKIGQKIKLDIAASQITDSIIKSISQDEKVQQLATKLENDIAPKAKGVSALTGLSAIYTFGGALCCLIIAVALYFIWNSDTSRKALNVGANVYKSTNPAAIAAGRAGAPAPAPAPV